MKRMFAAVALAASVLGAAGSANAATLLGATSVRITSAIPNYIQIAELLAFDTMETNVAFAGNGGVATGSSQYSAESQPVNAIDGLFPRSYYDVPGIFHSLGAGSGEFLNVSFAAPTSLNRLTVYGRTDCCSDRDFFNFTVFGVNNTVLASGTLDARATGSASVNFAAAGVVPEPAAWTMMIAGFGGIGAILRRRRSPAVA